MLWCGLRALRRRRRLWSYCIVPHYVRCILRREWRLRLLMGGTGLLLHVFPLLGVVHRIWPQLWLMVDTQGLLLEVSPFLGVVHRIYRRV